MFAIRSLAFYAMTTLIAAVLPGQVDLKHEAVVYFGSGSHTTAPATIDEDKVREATPEWQTIQSEGVRKGTARYTLLMGELDKRIRCAVRAAVSGSGKDLVVRSGDIQDSKGKTVADLTDAVISKLDKQPLACHSPQ